MPDSSSPQAPTTSQDIKGTIPAYLRNATPAQIPAFMPGQLDMLSKQLSAGFGASPKAFVDYLSKIYQPANTMNFGAQPIAPKTPAPKPGGGSIDIGGRNGMVLVDGKWKRFDQTSIGRNAR